MSLKILNLDPQLAQRIRKQIERDDADDAARKGQLTPQLIVQAAGLHVVKQLAKGIKSVNDVLNIKPKKRLRQDQGPLMNKLEQGWHDHLKHFGFNGESVHYLRAQAMRWRLGNGAWYRTDVTCWLAGRLACFECKGPKEMRGMDRGTLTVKVAAGLYPEADWYYVWKPQGGSYQWQRVLP